MEVNSEMTIAMCLSHCRANGYSYAGVEYKEECHCGNYPEGGFDSRYTWPNKCDMKCPGDASQNCGGAGAMSVWSVPNDILFGLCVYDHPFDGRVLPDYSITGIDNLTQWSCKDICFKKGKIKMSSMVLFTFKLKNLGFWYYGTENGDSCYCGRNADKFVPASPSVCSMPCSGDADSTCGSAYRMKAYGPIHFGPNIAFQPNQIEKEDIKLYKFWEIDVSIKLDAQLDTKSNIYGLMVSGSTYPDPESQIPAVFVKPNSMMVEICMKVGEEALCEDLKEVTVGEWFNLWIEQWCWTEDQCGVYFFLNNEFRYRYVLPGTPVTYNAVDFIIGNTYGQSDIVAASGVYVDLLFSTYEERDNPSDKIDAAALNADALNA